MNYEYQEAPVYDREMEDSELAQELLTIQNEAELDHFLGGVFRSAWRGAKSLYNSSLGRQIRSQAVSGLKSYAQKALPGLGRSVGGRLFGQTGAQYGGQLGDFAAQQLGGQQQEEVARMLIKTARDASRRIAHHAVSGRPVNAGVVKGHIIQAAKRWMPQSQSDLSFLRGGGFSRYMDREDADAPSSPNSGTWIRQGNKIVLKGV
jgi:hypothetical protein